MKFPKGFKYQSRSVRLSFDGVNRTGGILHQAETTDGWKIRRKGILFDLPRKTVNATRFHRQLAHCLDTYCNALTSQPWNSLLWAAFTKKMKAIFKNA
ncbi:MAG TPA: hypothetical protein VIT88_01105 [Pyrinomonadaceae bacterium]